MNSHVPDITRCKKLAELGFPQVESLFVWDTVLKVAISRQQAEDSLLFHGIFIAAPLASESGEWLPHYIFPDADRNTYYLRIEHLLHGWLVSYVSDLSEYSADAWHEISADTMTNAMADMAIWLLENGYMP